MDTSTLLVVFLLVTAATLASYALSYWSSRRGPAGAGWAATSIGTTLLLTAAAIVVLTFVFKGPLWRPNFGTEQQSTYRSAASPEISAPEVSTGPMAASVLPTVAAASPAAPTASRAARPVGSIYDTGDNHQSLTAATTPSTAERIPEPLGTFVAGEPWVATRCVHLHPPGSDVTRYKIENDCDVPVAVIVSICSADARDCAPGRQLIFPAKLQRPVTLDEQTVVGNSVRYVACFVASATARSLIGAPSEERSTSEWREQFESARVSDGCLSEVQSWVEQSRRTRVPIDVLVGYGGNNVP